MAVSVSPAQLNKRAITALGLMTLLSIMIGMYAVSFQMGFSGDPDFHIRFGELPVFSSMHVVGGAVVLLFGGFQFWPNVRQKFPQWHRWAGRLYLSFVAIGGVGGLVLAPFSQGGLVAHFGFGTLAVLWLFSGWQAFVAIRKGDVATHKAWMMRNYSMAFGAVMLRIYLGLFAVAGIPFEEAYPTTAWISWVPNLILVEWYLAMTASKLVRRKVPAQSFERATV